MRTAQWTLVFFLATLSLLGALYSGVLGDDGGHPADPSHGSLAPVFDPLPPRIERFRLRDTPGRVVDLDADSLGIVVLARNGWYYQSAERGWGWFGEETTGAPHWLSRAESIALAEGTVFILEPQRSILSVWDTTGSRLGEVAIPVRRDMAQRATRVIIGPSGRPVVVLQGMDQDGTGYWEIIELDRAGGVTGSVSLPNREPTAIYQEPRLAARGLALLAMSSLSQELWAVELEHGRLHPIASREAPPLWSLPRTEHRKHKEVLAQMSGSMAALAQLPEHWPSVREFTIQEDGTILQATAAGEVTIQLEQLNTRLRPLGRANRDGFTHPVFLARGRAFVAEERVEETVVYEICF